MRQRHSSLKVTDPFQAKPHLPRKRKSFIPPDPRRFVAAKNKSSDDENPLQVFKKSIIRISKACVNGFFTEEQLISFRDLLNDILEEGESSITKKSDPEITLELCEKFQQILSQVFGMNETERKAQFLISQIDKLIDTVSTIFESKRLWGSDANISTDYFNQIKQNCYSIFELTQNDFNAASETILSQLEILHQNFMGEYTEFFNIMIPDKNKKQKSIFECCSIIKEAEKSISANIAALDLPVKKNMQQFEQTIQKVFNDDSNDDFSEIKKQTEMRRHRKSESSVQKNYGNSSQDSSKPVQGRLYSMSLKRHSLDFRGNKIKSPRVQPRVHLANKPPEKNIHNDDDKLSVSSKSSKTSHASRTSKAGQHFDSKIKSEIDKLESTLKSTQIGTQLMIDEVNRKAELLKERSNLQKEIFDANQKAQNEIKELEAEIDKLRAEYVKMNKYDGDIGPFLDPQFAEETKQRYLESDIEYLSNLVEVRSDMIRFYEDELDSIKAINNSFLNKNTSPSENPKTKKFQVSSSSSASPADFFTFSSSEALKKVGNLNHNINNKKSNKENTNNNSSNQNNYQKNVQNNNENQNDTHNKIKLNNDQSNNETKSEEENVGNEESVKKAEVVQINNDLTNDSQNNNENQRIIRKNKFDSSYSDYSNKPNIFNNSSDAQSTDLNSGKNNSDYQNLGSEYDQFHQNSSDDKVQSLEMLQAKLSKFSPSGENSSQSESNKIKNGGIFNVSSSETPSDNENEGYNENKNENIESKEKIEHVEDEYSNDNNQERQKIVAHEEEKEERGNNSSEKREEETQFDEDDRGNEEKFYEEEEEEKIDNKEQHKHEERYSGEEEETKIAKENKGNGDEQENNEESSEDNLQEINRENSNGENMKSNENKSEYESEISNQKMNENENGNENNKENRDESDSEDEKDDDKPTPYDFIKEDTDRLKEEISDLKAQLRTINSEYFALRNENNKIIHLTDSTFRTKEIELSAELLRVENNTLYNSFKEIEERIQNEEQRLQIFIASQPLRVRSSTAEANSALEKRIQYLKASLEKIGNVETASDSNPQKSSKRKVLKLYEVSEHARDTFIALEKARNRFSKILESLKVQMDELEYMEHNCGRKMKQFLPKSSKNDLLIIRIESENARLETEIENIENEALRITRKFGGVPSGKGIRRAILSLKRTAATTISRNPSKAQEAIRNYNLNL
ncbi:hypothetical protein TRFO_18588 [Tritrichomonas foetus]|uniref:Uncharacterized protein n=1 Tax=Tritrichomonas foetus TaxID=1144522 RepID=A0A1J4KQ34_9EUKA|nr:hypothetical protein TRFO_18588 [Tritrichomonas foetus]|eukprot:OHT11806.1 hypothetical protein TRFO_18588 [Tritrichomonas foetus]